MSRVSAERALCVGAGNCVVAASEVFDQDDDGIVVVLADEVTGEAAEHARAAVTLCPASALTLRE